MRFFWSFFWAILISGVISYVLTSMAGNEFQPISTLIVAIILTLVVYVLGEGVLKAENEH
ncbi:Protein of unknown function [Lentibacillus halodurans]|uniref:DUF2929 domain-containing protein n=1 Tax=Lentibacillus halodurans TaxID=237679 RepID=A0A1I0W2N0_9BACI|nr:DUF2929 family protein [Lentibacillus halodurans]SFA82333.1 Protein of unknown function [Lentibacillus halodurans]